MEVMYNRAPGFFVLKWGRKASGSGSWVLPWRPKYTLPNPTHFSETYCVPSSRKQVRYFIPSSRKNHTEETILLMELL